MQNHQQSKPESEWCEATHSFLCDVEIAGLHMDDPSFDRPTIEVAGQLYLDLDVLNYYFATHPKVVCRWGSTEVRLGRGRGPLPPFARRMLTRVLSRLVHPWDWHHFVGIPWETRPVDWERVAERRRQNFNSAPSN